MKALVMTGSMVTNCLFSLLVVQKGSIKCNPMGRHCLSCPSGLMEPPSITKQCHLQHSLTHWGRVTYICANILTIIGTNNGLSPGQRQAIIWTNAGISLIRLLGTNFSEFLITIHVFSFKKIHLKMSSGKSRPSCLGLNELTYHKQVIKCHTNMIECCQ